MRLAGGFVAALMIAAALLVSRPGGVAPNEAAIRRALQSGTGTVELPAGVIEISAELSIARSAHDLEIRGAPSGSTLRASDRFNGRAILSCDSASRIRFTGFSINGNRRALEQRTGLAPYDRPFAQFTRANGILALHVAGIEISGVRFANIAGFAILASASREVSVDGVRIEDSGSRNPASRNNATGGVLLEEGTEHFHVTQCELRNVLGNGIWTHSLYTSPRSDGGRIAENRFEQIGRDAIQVGHARCIRVERNTGRSIGYPVEVVDVEGHGFPVAIDTAGNVDHSAYVENRFEEINGKCIDLDGFHDGEVRGNTCLNPQPAAHYPYGHYGIIMNDANPDMRPDRVHIIGNEIDGALYGGIFVIGAHNRVAHNRLRRLNLARCAGDPARPGCNYAADQPDLLRSAIYLGAGAERPAPAHDNVIEDNQASGFGISKHCVSAAPGVSLAANTVSRNVCKENPAH